MIIYSPSTFEILTEYAFLCITLATGLIAFMVLVKIAELAVNKIEGMKNDGI